VEVSRQKVVPRRIRIGEFSNYVLVGIRRAGKSFLLYQKIQQLLHEGTGWDEMLYLNFEDERLTGLQTEDLNLLLETHMEMYGKRPMLFFG
jgi:predicted AAA+ superfamily ATPase